jgi:hypothetical protein
MFHPHKDLVAELLTLVLLMLAVVAVVVQQQMDKMDPGVRAAMAALVLFQPYLVLM